MKIVASFLGLVLMAPLANGSSLHEPEFFDVRTLVLEAQADPRGTARKFGEWWFSIGRADNWERQYKIELAALDVIGYFAELQLASSSRRERPVHSLRHVHDPFFFETIQPQNLRNHMETFDARANYFAKALLRDLFEREEVAERVGQPTLLASKLVAALIRSGREFWFGHVLREVIDRRMPITAELSAYARVLPDHGYERFLAALTENQWDFRGAQEVVDNLVAARVENLLDVPFVGDPRCDAMLSVALRNHD